MYHVKEDERAHKLMYKAFELSLSTPTKSQIAKTILSNEDCNKIQSANNLNFLNEVRNFVVTFLKKNEIEYEKHNNLKDNPECDCDYDCECYLNEFIMPAFKDLALKFEPYINDDFLVHHIPEEYTIEEKERLLSCNLKEVLRLKLYKGLACLAFEHGLYNVSCWHHEAAVLMYGGSIVGESFNPSEYVESELSARAKIANEARWQGHVQRLRGEYLELDKSRQSELGKKLTIKAVATWIYEHHNKDKLEYETIRDHLSKARKGVFTND